MSTRPTVTLYGGKGGVGKTTCAAATGIAHARADERTLVVSTDPAHSLSDAFDEPVGTDPTTIRPRLDAMETDPAQGLDQYRALFEELVGELRTVGVRVDDDQVRDLFTSGLLPGSDELAALEVLAGIADEDYDRVVVDTAPTGHTLRLLDLPAAVSRGVETAQSLRDQVRRKADAARTMLFGPYGAMGRDETDFESLLADLQGVRTLLRNPERTDFRVVCLAERMVIAETERLVEELREAAVPVDRLFVNRLVETEPDHCDRCRARWDTQQERLTEIAETFPELALTRLPDQTGNDGAVLASLADHIER
ncbi:MAG: arsenite-transporting ATPase [Haloarculaceae archaeon]|jgi:arsenite-transporting ATPase